MGICTYFQRLTPEQLQAVQGDLELFWDLTTSNDDIRQPPTSRDLDIDKSAVDIDDFLNDGAVTEDGPLSKTIFGGTPFALRNVGFDPESEEEPEEDDSPCYLTPAEVQDVARALNEFAQRDPRQRFTQVREARSVALEQQLGRPFKLSSDDGRFTYLMHHFVRLVAYYQAAAEAGDAIVVDHV